MNGGSRIIRDLMHHMANAPDNNERIALGQQVLNHVDLLECYGDDMNSQMHDFKRKYEDLLRKPQ